MTKRRKNGVGKYVILTLIGVVLCKIGHKSATAWRGYESIGGEHLFLLLPVLYALMHETVAEVVQDIKKSVGRSGKISD